MNFYLFNQNIQMSWVKTYLNKVGNEWVHGVDMDKNCHPYSQYK